MTDFYEQKLPIMVGRPGETWKVTARYVVRLGDGGTLACVRVRCGIGPVLHFTEDEFERMFEPTER